MFPVLSHLWKVSEKFRVVKKVEIVDCPLPPTHIDNEGENTELLRLSWGDDRGSKIKLIKFVRTQFQVSRLIISITSPIKTIYPENTRNENCGWIYPYRLWSERSHWKLTQKCVWFISRKTKKVRLKFGNLVQDFAKSCLFNYFELFQNYVENKFWILPFLYTIQAN